MLYSDTLVAIHALSRRRVPFERIGRSDGPRLEISYEEFLSKPDRGLESVAEFAGIGVDAQRVREVAEQAESGRAFAFRESAELAAFADREASRLQACGY